VGMAGIRIEKKEDSGYFSEKGIYPSLGAS
jgi:hypothetical protein